MTELNRYPFSGHAVIMGNTSQPWQNSEKILRLFGKQAGTARKKYQEFVVQGIKQGRRDDLVGGGLVRSSGGWSAVKELKRV